jgi:hypothetical protein
MSGAIPPLPLNAFVACTGTTFKSVINEFVIWRLCLSAFFVSEIIIMVWMTRGFRGVR